MNSEAKKISKQRGKPMAKKAQVSEKTNKMPDQVFTVEIKFHGSNNFEDIEEFSDEVFTSKTESYQALGEVVEGFSYPVSAFRVTSYRKDTDDADSRPEDELIVGLHHEGTGFEVYKKTTAEEIVESILDLRKPPFIAKYIQDVAITEEGTDLFKDKRRRPKSKSK
jgi:hypothetical protein